MKTTFKIILSLIFLFAGVVKILDTDAFSSSIESFRILPAALLPITAHTMPIIEIICAIGIWIPVTEGACLLIISTLCVLFAMLYTSALIQGIHPDCGCFGKNPLLKADPPMGIIRALILALISSIAWLKNNNTKKEV